MIVSIQTLQALRTGFKALFQKGLGLAKPKSDVFTTEVASTTKVETYGFLGDMPIFRKWVGEKRWKSIKEKAYQLINDAYESSIGIHKHKIQDDNLGLYGPIIQGWGEESGALKDRLCFDALANGHQRPCFDGQNFFDDEHPVGNGVKSNISADGGQPAWFLLVCSKALKPILYQNREAPHFEMITDPKSDHVIKTGEFLASGEARGAAGYTYWQLAYRSTQPLNKANYEAAKLAIRSLTNDEGEPLGLSPTHIVVGVSTTAAARDLFLKQNLAGGESNTLFKDVEIVEADRLP